MAKDEHGQEVDLNLNMNGTSVLRLRGHNISFEAQCEILSDSHSVHSNQLERPHK